MNIDELIKNLQSMKKRGTKNIVYVLWTADEFDRKDDAKWAQLAEDINGKIDTSDLYDHICGMINYLESNY